VIQLLKRRALVLALALSFGLTGGAFIPAAVAQSAASVTCQDGTTGKAGRGACSHHGGVRKGDAATTQQPANQASAPSTQSTPSAPATPSTSASPSTSAAEAVTCQDGTTGKAGRGACSHHGGVRKGDGGGSGAPTTSSATGTSGSTSTNPTTNMGRSPTSSSKQPSAGTGDAAGATAKCKDGTYSHSKHHQGTCSHHGGVAQWLDTQ
jgi:hypothetical protein